MKPLCDNDNVIKGAARKKSVGSASRRTMTMIPTALLHMRTYTRPRELPIQKASALGIDDHDCLCPRTNAHLHAIHECNSIEE